MRSTIDDSASQITQNKRIDIMDDETLDQSELPAVLKDESEACAFNSHQLLAPSVLGLKDLLRPLTDPERKTVNGFVQRLVPEDEGEGKTTYGKLVPKFKDTPIGKSQYLLEGGTRYSVTVTDNTDAPDLHCHPDWSTCSLCWL